MFFRRPQTRTPSLDDRIQALRAVGFEARSTGGSQLEVRRGCCAAHVEQADGPSPRIARSGLLIGGELAVLIDGGYMKFFQTPSGRRRPALSKDLKELQDFREDLREALGLPSLYNESLGTVCEKHAYDRLSGRPM